MPRIDFSDFDWDPRNIAYATKRGITIAEIESVARGTKDWSPNKRGRSGNVATRGHTEAGRLITVIALWNPETRLLRPVNAWEGK